MGLPFLMNRIIQLVLKLFQRDCVNMSTKRFMKVLLLGDDVKEGTRVGVEVGLACVALVEMVAVDLVGCGSAWHF